MSLDLETKFDNYLRSGLHYYACIIILEKGRDIPAKRLRIAFTDDDQRLGFNYSEIQSELIPNSLWLNPDAPSNFLNIRTLEDYDYDEDDESPVSDYKWPTPNDFVKNCLKDLAARNRELILYAIPPCRANHTWYDKVINNLIIPYMKMCGILEEKICFCRDPPKRFNAIELTDDDILDNDLEIRFNGPIEYFDIYRISEIIDIKFTEYEIFHKQTYDIKKFDTRFELLCNKTFDVDIVLKSNNKAAIVYKKGTDDIILINEMDTESFICAIYKMFDHIMYPGHKAFIKSNTTKIVDSFDKKMLNYGYYRYFYENYMV